MTNGVIQYTIDQSGVLTGRWAQVVGDQQQYQTGTERAVPRCLKEDIAGSYDAEIYDSTGATGWKGTLVIEGTRESFRTAWLPSEEGMGVFSGVGFMPQSDAAVAAYWSVS
ncbi:MAG TPA: hypothetical protein VGF48_04520 [Thermoanaerobaculia bacterium]|jgi:hypothetical protein